jgi:hypothetical protein
LSQKITLLPSCIFRIKGKFLWGTKHFLKKLVCFLCHSVKSMFFGGFWRRWKGNLKRFFFSLFSLFWSCGLIFWLWRCHLQFTIKRCGINVVYNNQCFYWNLNEETCPIWWRDGLFAWLFCFCCLTSWEKILKTGLNFKRNLLINCV